MSYEDTSETTQVEGNDIPEAVRVIIGEEVNKDIAYFFEEGYEGEEGDQETAEFYRGVMQDLRLRTYSVLAWLNKTEKPEGKVLFPASGLDSTPKLAFGEEKVVHTSLENERETDQGYFDQLGSGMKVIADNNALPFADKSFGAICLLDSQKEIIGNDPDIYLRVLKPNGIVVLSKNNVFNPEDDRIEHYSQIPSLEQVSIPDHFQMQGESQAEFALFRKIG